MPLHYRCLLIVLANKSLFHLNHHNHPISTHHSQSGEETFFKVKKHTKMSKIFNAYASRKGVDASSLRFLLDGENIEQDATPKMLELEDQDQIDAVLEQVGGMWRY
jgi:small ubiquitin-related modifier